MSAKAKVGLVLEILVCVVCLVFIAWWVVLQFFGQTKILSYNVNIDKQVVASKNELGEVKTTEKALFEINIYDNFYEVVINLIWDEKQELFYSYCFQFVANNNEKLNIYSVFKDAIYTSKGYNERKEGGKGAFGLFTDIYRDRDIVLGNQEYKNLTLFTYKGVSDGTVTNWQKDDKLLQKMNEKDSFLTIQLTNSDKSKTLYGMQPRNENIEFERNGEFYFDKYTSYGDYDSYQLNHDYYINYRYRTCDILYILEKIYSDCLGLNSGTDEDRYLLFNDYFNYKVYKDGSYVDLLSGDSRYAKLDETVKTRIVSHVKRSEGLCVSANNSLIGWLKGVENYGVTADNTFTYSTSSGIKNVTENDFVIQQIDGDYTLILCDEFVENFSKYSGKIRLNIALDMTKFSELSNIKINTGEFYVYKLNETELNIRLENYDLGVA